MDVLSTVLKTVKLEGAMFFNAEFSAPWCFRSPPSRQVAPHLTLEAKHVIIYHLLTHGRAYANVDGGSRVSLSAGDIVVFPHGDPHIMGNGRDVEPRDNGRFLQEIMSQGLKPARMGGGGEITRFICGYLVCDRQLSKAFLAGLPPLFKVNIGSDSSGQWLESSIRYSVEQAVAAQTGSEIVVAKLSEALFVDTLRRYVEQLPPGQTGWLAGARDPDVGNALALVHRQPSDPWTIAELARQVGVSRSVLAERFRHFLGVPPMAYLTRWRLQLGAQMLASTSRSVAQIASEVGYESEPAFNRAFKREFGSPPARFRMKSKAATARQGALAGTRAESATQSRPA
ncbi:MAG TPA: AraC family transcriptional regulator [Terriglobales bacterium]|jgi:AraC-like DNA-binding protein|nr:AraC family transcriptional regulator [Terriglobales bacterium]